MVFVNDVLEHGGAGLAVVEIAAEEDIVETVVQDVEAGALLHISPEVCGVGLVAVAQEEGLVFALQALQKSDMTVGEVGNDGVPGFDDLGVV